MGKTNSEFTRRKFIAASVGGLASAGLAGISPRAVLAQEGAETVGESEVKIIYRQIGKTGLKAPIVSMGTGACNDPAVVQACYEAGMRLFDTAAGYALGRNEQLIGNVLNRMAVRDKSLILTKVHTPAQRQGLSPEKSKDRLTKTFEGCLKRLKTDHVDILMVHDVRDAETIRDEAIMEAMSRLKEQGKTRAIGVSTHASMAAVINEVVNGGFYEVVLTSINFTMADDNELLGAIANAASKGVGIIGMKVLAGGARFPNPDTLRDYDTPTINAAALKWVLHNENIATTIPGIGNFDHLRANFPVAGNLEYTDQEEKFLSDNRITLGFGFCRQCSKCLASCPHGVDIPDLMRTHMYAAQYADFQLARNTLREIPGERGLQVCSSCSTCEAKCANSVDIERRIDELKLIYG